MSDLIETYQPDVVITAGGTREQIDDVRYIGNFSGGRLGAALASQYVRLGHSVLLLAPNSVGNHCSELYDPMWTENPFQHRTFASAEDLRQSLLSLSGAKLILHAAAVADYAPERVEGKIPSDEDELTIRLKRTPKILSELRDHFGEDTTIVGFKLLSGVTEETLIRTGIKQIETNLTDYCIANDLQDIGTEGNFRRRKLHVIHKNGSYETVEDITSNVAKLISQKIGVRNWVQCDE